jgi:hypothetical protein
MRDGNFWTHIRRRETFWISLENKRINFSGCCIYTTYAIEMPVAISNTSISIHLILPHILQ